MFTVNQLKEYLESLPQNQTLPFTFYPCSWRGDYSEPCMVVRLLSPELSFFTVSHAREQVRNLLSQTFQGYKGGDYQFNGEQYLHFEFSDSESMDTAALALSSHAPDFMRGLLSSIGIPFPATPDDSVLAFFNLVRKIRTSSDVSLKPSKSENVSTLSLTVDGETMGLSKANAEEGTIYFIVLQKGSTKIDKDMYEGLRAVIFDSLED